MNKTTITLSKLAELIGAELSGDGNIEASGICSIEDIQPGCVTYLEKSKDSALLDGTQPAAVICSKASALTGHNLLVCDNPKIAFIKAVSIFRPEPELKPGVHALAFVHPEATVDPSACVGPLAVIERGARVGAGAFVAPLSYVGENAVIGAGCRLHPQSSVLRECTLGDRVILHSGVTIGADGFGYVFHEGRHLKVPQTGTVVIEDDVEIGANSAVDRATIGETRIGRGTKIDNLVQVGHNCVIGENAILCGQTGISGSCTIGGGAVLAGQVGVGDHLKIGQGAVLGGRAGVISDIPEGKFYSGMPAAPHRDTMKQYSAIARLPRLEEELARLKEEIEFLKKDRR